jgi:hypothetical protein
VALANHYFPDVLNSNPFHDDIAAMADAGITAGLGDGNYHPSDPVTRQTMAAFLHRGFGTVGMEVDTALLSSVIVPMVNATSTSPQAVRQITVNVPGATNAFGPDQRVHLVGRITFLASMSTNAMTQGCPCEFKAFIQDMGTMMAAAGQSQTFESTSGLAYTYNFDVEALFTATPGPHTYELDVFLKTRAVGTPMSAFGIDTRSSLSATTYPFDN